MVGLHLLAAALALVGAVATGTLAHELLHAAVLRAAGVPCELHVGSVPPRGADRRAPGRLGGLGGALASVRPLAVPDDPLPLRVASLAPLVLALPLVLVAAGVLPDPFAGGDVVAQAAFVGWLACALPSPADFGVAFHAGELVEREDLAVGADAGDA